MSEVNPVTLTFGRIRAKCRGWQFYKVSRERNVTAKLLSSFVQQLWRCCDDNKDVSPLSCY